MALRDQFIIASAEICSALIQAKHTPALLDEDFKKKKGGNYIKVGGKYVPTTFETHKSKRNHFVMVTDNEFRLSRDAVAIAAHILDITQQYSLPDEITTKPNVISIHRQTSEE